MSKSTKIIAALGIAAGLGVAALPLSSFAALDLNGVNGDAKTMDVTVSATVGSSVAIAVNAATEPATINLTANASGTSTSKVEYATNSSTGLTLSLKDKDTDLNLKSGDTDVIPAAAAVAAGTSAWNITGGTSVCQAGAAITSADQEVVKTTAAVNDSTTMTYGVSTSADQHPGTYTDVITYTASINS